MAGGLMQLVAYGAQDVYLTGNPQITFFKVVYRRHTNFAIESIEQTFNGTPDFGKKVHCTISRNGDLVSNMTLKLDIELTDAPATPFAYYAWSAFLGHRILNYVDIEIGGTRIDRQYGEWMHLWNQLTLPAAKEDGYNRMIGHKLGIVGKQTSGTGAIIPLDAADIGDAQTFSLNIPLQFWFCRNPGLALPLIALQYHEVRVTVDFRAAVECFTGYSGADDFSEGTPLKPTDVSITDANLFVDYIYLDTDERRRFAQLTHEYLIEQVQYTGAETITTDTNKIKLNFNHPIKELVWVVQKQKNITHGEYFNYTKEATENPLNPGGERSATMDDADPAIDLTGPVGSVNMCAAAKLQLNGGDRFSERDGDYFNLVQPYYHHSRIPYTGINSYSFALRPEEHQPSGTCNFSRLDSAVLMLTTDGVTAVDEDAEVRVYALNYNVLRVMSGMGGLAYSN